MDLVLEIDRLRTADIRGVIVGTIITFILVIVTQVHYNDIDFEVLLVFSVLLLAFLLLCYSLSFFVRFKVSLMMWGVLD